MCCIFTCCGWMLDLIQRCWIFFMSCCISSAVCCVLLTASTSGIALGYNYSLAEYIDLKETNISVYIKRGVFDDDIADDMEWRRSGGGKVTVVPEQPQEYNLRRSEQKSEEKDAGDTTIRPGRRLDDSLYESENQNKYEGSLMRLTGKGGQFHPSPPYIPPTEPATERDVRQGPRVEDLVSESPPGSLDRLKAIQTVINARRAAQRNKPQQLEGRRNLGPQTPDPHEQEYKFLEQYPGFPVAGGARRHGEVEAAPAEPGPESPFSMPRNPYRDAVPPPDINNLPIGRDPPFENPKINKHFDNVIDGDMDQSVTFPRKPPTVKPSPIRPPPRPLQTKQRIVVPDRPPISRTGHTIGTTKESFKDDLDKYKQRLLINQYDAPNFKPDDFDQRRPEGDDYDEGFKGRPVRRKRSAQYMSEEPRPYYVISDFIILNGDDADPSLINDAHEIDVTKQVADASDELEKYSTRIIKIKRKVVRANPKKQIRKQKTNKNKKRGKKRPTSKIRKTVTGIQRKWRKGRGRKTSTAKKNIDKLPGSSSYFISKLTPSVTTATPSDGKSGVQVNKTETTIQEAPVTLSLSQLLFL